MRKIKKKLPSSYNKLYPILLFVATLFMGLGYASLNPTALTVGLMATAEKQSGIFISDINVLEASNAVSLNVNGNQNLLYTNISLSSEHIDSYITYELKIYNGYSNDYQYVGYSCDSEFYSNDQISFELESLNDSNIINPNNYMIFILKFKYNSSTLPSNNMLDAYISFNFEEVQANNLYKTIVVSAVADNVSSEFVKSSTGIDFHSISSNSNGKGLYAMSSTINDDYPIYYYRGDVTNNNLKFAGYCWKIVRTTDTGGVKIIYNGEPAFGTNTCDTINVTAQQKNINAFSSDASSPSSVGYMQGTKYASQFQAVSPNTYLYGNDVVWNGSSYTLEDTVSVMMFGDGLTSISNKYHYTCFNTSGTCNSVSYIYYTNMGAYYITLSNGKKLKEAKEDMFSNQTSSLLKTAFENFYNNSSNGLVNYKSKLENTIWCNDRKTYSGGLHSEDSDASKESYFMNYYKLNNSSYLPTLNCENYDDQFSLSVDNGGKIGFGNNLLTYPIATLTIDEAMLAGLTGSDNSNNYLNIGLNWWTLSPAIFQYSGAYNYIVGQNGELSTNGLVSYDQIGIRPVVSLKNSVVFEKGTGTTSDPYIIE